jgi:hypothetical protein
VSNPPANPMSIELTMATTQVWWQARQRQEDRPEHWKVSADVWASVACEPQHRHVGDFELAVVNVNANRHPLDPMELGGWAVEFMEHGLPDGPEDAIFAKRGAQVKGRDPKVAFLRGFKLAGGWQGHGLAGPLIAATLDRFSGIAQLGVCRVSGADFIDDFLRRSSIAAFALHRGADVVHQHLCARGRHRPREIAADAAARAGDEHGFALKAQSRKPG